MSFWDADIVGGAHAPGMYRTIEPGPVVGRPEVTSMNNALAHGSTQGLWKLTFRDYCAEHTASVAEAQLILNGAPPEVEIDGPTGPTRDPRPTFTFRGWDVASYQCSIDQGEARWGWCSDVGSHTPETELPDGSYTFRLRAEGMYGDSPVFTREFEIDTLAPPPPTLAFAGGEIGKKLTASVRGETSDDTADVLLWAAAGCQGDPLAQPVAPAELKRGIEVSVDEEGTAYYSARARDAAGNRSACATARYRHDGTPPTVAIGKVKVNARKRSARVKLRASDNVTAAAGLALSCKLDGGAWKPCRSPLRLKRLKPGRHALRARARDEAGNKSAVAVKRFRVPKPKRRG